MRTIQRVPKQLPTQDISDSQICTKYRKYYKNTFTFWKWKRILKKNYILKPNAHSETHFESENKECQSNYPRKISLAHRFVPSIENITKTLSHFENESEFWKRTTFWNRMLIPKPILKVKTKSAKAITHARYLWLTDLYQV